MVPEQAESLFQGLILFSFSLWPWFLPVSFPAQQLRRGRHPQKTDTSSQKEIRAAAGRGGSAGQGAGTGPARAEVPGAKRKRRSRRAAQKKKRRRKLSVTPRASGPQDPCPLCDEAKEVLEAYKNRFILQEVDITLPENSAWYQRYKFDIPVFHLNGQFLMMHRVDISKLEKQLQKLEQQGL
ncbi:glutaredoxin-like protein C5orf63 homolog isoform X1 [Panthera onca]